MVDRARAGKGHRRGPERLRARRTNAAPEQWPEDIMCTASLSGYPPFAVRGEQGGWTVYDVETDQPARVNSKLQIGLSLDAAERLADTLSEMHGDMDDEE